MSGGKGYDVARSTNASLHGSVPNQCTRVLPLIDVIKSMDSRENLVSSF